MKVSPLPSTPGQSNGAINRSTITLNTGNPKSGIAQKLDAIKQRFTPSQQAPANKQGEIIPPQPSGAATSLPEPNKAISSTPIEAPKTSSADSGKELSPQMTMLARQQQSLRKAQQQLKADQEAWKQEQAKYLQKDILSSDPLKALAEAGITQDRLVELQLNQSSPPSETDILKNEIAELRKQLAGVDDKFTARDKQAYDNAVQVIERDAKLLVNSDPAYETTKALGAEGTKEVVELIKKQFALDGTILDVEDAAKQIEELALEREVQRIQRFQQLAKIKERLAPKTEAPSASEGTESKQSQSSSSASQTHTITNKMGVSRPLTARERAMLAFENAAKRTS